MNANNLPVSFILATGTAVPPVSVSQKKAAALMDEHYRDILTDRARAVLHKTLSHPGIKKRYFAADSAKELLTFKNEDPDRRVERFTRWAIMLSTNAARTAMKKAKVHPSDITAIVVNTCTGYLCPGLATYMIEELGLTSGVYAHDLVGSGCGGAVPNIQMGKSLIADDPEGVALCISVEICSATFEMDNDMSLIISNAIFGDGAAAAVVSHRRSGFEIIAMKSEFVPQHRDDVRYVYRNGRLHNRLSSGLPKIIGELVPSFINDFLAAHHLSRNGITRWALHPGGAKMLDLLQERLALSEKDMEPARTIYAEFGNMSSPTVLFELDRITAHGIGPHDLCFMAAYGAGLSIHGMLLKRTGR